MRGNKLVQGKGGGGNDRNCDRQLYKVLYTNCRSILNKIDLLRTHVSVFLPDFVCLVETFCRQDITDAYLALEGYNLVSRKDGVDTVNGHCRGLLLYCKVGIRATKLDLEGIDSFTECTGVSIPWGNNGGSLSLVLVYRPPEIPGSAADAGNTEKMCQFMRGLVGNVVCVGDFNLPDINWELGWAGSEGSKMVLDVVQDMFWHQHVMEPTHIAGNILDLALSSSAELIAGVSSEGYLGAADHVILDVDLVGPKQHDTYEEVPDWGKANFDAIRTAMQDVDWEAEFSNKPGLDCLTLFQEVLDREVNRSVPKKRRRQNFKPVWMNKSLMRMIRKKKRAWKFYSSDPRCAKDYQSFQAYKNIQKDVKKAVKQAKRKLERKLAKQYKKNNKAFHSYIKKKTSNRVTVGPLKDEEDALITDDGKMANLLNSFFCSVFTREDTDSIPEAENLYTGQDPLVSVDITVEKVKSKLASLKPSSAPGPDSMWPRVLQRLSDVLAKPLAIIFTKFLGEGTVPPIWKTANVCPIFKKGSKTDPGNYRPVSLTCVICKVMESVLRDSIVEHLSVHKLIRDSQHGFMSGRSCLTNLLEYLEALTRWVDEGASVDVVYLDFAKAFDKVPTARLIEKCRGVGIGGRVLDWIQEWLSGRKQRVVLNGQASTWDDVWSGVPQGSVLGPTLFLIYINDIDKAVEVSGSILKKFADDTKFAMVVESDDARAKFQSGLDNLQTWSEDWQMLFNVTKCKIIHMGKKNQHYSYTMDGRTLEEVDSEKDVGVVIHKSLKPSLQCAKAAAKANLVLGQLSRAVTYRDKETFIRLYTVYVRPHLEYAVQSWSPWTVGDKEVLEQVQRRAVKMVSNLRGQTYEERLAELGMVTLETRRLRGDMIQTFRIMSGIDQVNPDTWFTPSNQLVREGASKTRSVTGLYRIQEGWASSEIRRNFFSMRVTRPWNNIPDQVKSASSVNGFKNNYDEWVSRRL